MTCVWLVGSQDRCMDGKAMTGPTAGLPHAAPWRASLSMYKLPLLTHACLSGTPADSSC